MICLAKAGSLGNAVSVHPAWMIGLALIFGFPMIYLLVRKNTWYPRPVPAGHIMRGKNMSETQSSDAMHNLVKFLICLAIAGTIIALVAYFAVVLPGQHAAGLYAPLNCNNPVCSGWHCWCT